ncbi:MAG: hypothetical protein ABI395_05540 [Sphingobium sp.]
MARRSDPPPVAIFSPFDASEIAAASGRAANAAIEADAALQEMRAIMGRFDQIHLLSRIAFLMIIGTLDPARQRAKPFIQAHEVELLQALALSHEQLAILDSAAIPEAIERLLHLAQAHTHAVQQMSLSMLSEDPKRNKVEAVLDRIRATTYTVRGPRHAYQTRAYVRALAADLDARFLAKLGFTVSDVADFMEAIAQGASDTLQALRNSAVQWMKRDDPEQMLKLFLADNVHLRDHAIIAQIEDGRIPLTQVRAALHAIFEEQLPAAFRLDWPAGAPQLDRLREHMRTLSIGFEGIDDEALTHLKLGNPVRIKPFVACADGELYLFCTQTCFANLVELIDEVAATDAGLKEDCEAFKAQWLERKLQQLVREAFPCGSTFDNAKWADADGKGGETDCIVTIDKTVGLFEAKSGRMTAPAKRGAKDRLKREIETLLVKPSRQSERFAALLRSTPEAVKLELSDGQSQIQRSNIREIFRINILFDTLGPLTAGTRRLVEAGFIDSAEPMAPTMSIFELETLFDLLPDQIARLHYLRRRAELERSVMVEADEMDLIAFYLESSFCIPHLEQTEDGFGIYGWSDRISRLYDQDGRRIATMPLKRTPFWQELLTKIEERGQPGWTRFGYRLSNVSYRDQWTVLKRREEVAKRARRVKPGQAAHSGAFDADGSNRTVIGLCVGKAVSTFGIEAHSRTTATEMARLAGAEEGLVLYWDVNDKASELRFIASYRPDCEDHLIGNTSLLGQIATP